MTTRKTKEPQTILPSISLTEEQAAPIIGRRVKTVVLTNDTSVIMADLPYDLDEEFATLALISGYNSASPGEYTADVDGKSVKVVVEAR